MNYLYALAAFLVGILVTATVAPLVGAADIPFALVLGIFNGWCVVGPLLHGCKPFTSPAAAARGERRLGT